MAQAMGKGGNFPKAQARATEAFHRPDWGSCTRRAFTHGCAVGLVLSPLPRLKNGRSLACASHGSGSGPNQNRVI